MQAQRGASSTRSPSSRRATTTTKHQSATRPRFAIYAVLLVIYFAFVLASPGHRYLSVESIRNICTDGAELLILTVGVTFVLIMGEIDLSVGSTLVLSSVVAAKVLIATSPEVNVAVSILLALLACASMGAFVGAVNGLVTTWLRIPSFIVTLGTLSVALGVADLMTDGSDVSGVPPALQNDFGVKVVHGVPLIVAVAVLVLIVLGLVVSQTGFGVHSYAIGSNRDAAVRAGIGVRRHVVSVFMISGALAGLAGFVELARFGTTNLGGHSLDPLNAVVAAAIGGVSVFGGRGGMSGIAAGVLIPTVIQSGLIVAGVNPFWQVISVGTLVIVAVGIDTNQRAAGPLRARLPAGLAALLAKPRVTGRQRD